MALPNRMNMLAGVGIALVGGFLVWILIGGSDNDQEETTSGQSGSTRSAGDATSDRPEETVQSLASNLETQARRNRLLEEQLQGLAEQLKSFGETITDLQDRNRTLREEQSVSATEELDDLEQRTEGLIEGIAERIDSLEGRLTAPDYPVSPPADGNVDGDGYVWYSSASGDIIGDGLTGQLDRILPADPDLPESFQESEVPPAPLPVWTIPADATLVESRALTALIGRVPIAGEVSDPMPFKILTGAENLLANGQTLPDIRHAIWSGVAFGDRTLQCVTGRLQQLTLIFGDGTIRTWPDAGSNGGQSPGGDLGWISDPRGFPCIPGTYVSNLEENLARLTAAATASGLAEAWAEREVETFRSGEGVVRTVTGDPGRYAAGKGLSSGIDEWTRIIAERARDTFDAVVVEPGMTLTVHVGRSIPIDWSPASRRVRHLARRTEGRSGGID